MSTTTVQTPTTNVTVTARVAELRELADTDLDAASRQAWAWIEKLGGRAGTDRTGAEKELNELFALGKAPTGLDGATEGILVAPLIQPAVDKFARALTSFWMPWQGKSFSAATGRGDNRLTGSARWGAKVPWPLYSTGEGEAGERLAFDFETRVEPGMLDPGIDVLVIDYAPVADNPRLIIRSIRDELVEIVPGANLGKILYRRKGGYSNIGFFALKS